MTEDQRSLAGSGAAGQSTISDHADRDDDVDDDDGDGDRANRDEQADEIDEPAGS